MSKEMNINRNMKALSGEQHCTETAVKLLQNLKVAGGAKVCEDLKVLDGQVWFQTGNSSRDLVLDLHMARCYDPPTLTPPADLSADAVFVGYKVKLSSGSYSDGLYAAEAGAKFEIDELASADAATGASVVLAPSYDLQTELLPTTGDGNLVHDGDQNDPYGLQKKFSAVTIAGDLNMKLIPYWDAAGALVAGEEVTTGPASYNMKAYRMLESGIKLTYSALPSVDDIFDFGLAGASDNSIQSVLDLAKELKAADSTIDGWFNDLGKGMSHEIAQRAILFNNQYIYFKSTITAAMDNSLVWINQLEEGYNSQPGSPHPSPSVLLADIYGMDEHVVESAILTDNADRFHIGLDLMDGQIITSFYGDDLSWSVNVDPTACTAVIDVAPKNGERLAPEKWMFKTQNSVGELVTINYEVKKITCADESSIRVPDMVPHELPSSASGDYKAFAQSILTPWLTHINNLTDREEQDACLMMSDELQNTYYFRQWDTGQENIGLLADLFVLRKFFLTEANITYDVTAAGLLSLSLSDSDIVLHLEDRTDGVLRFTLDTFEYCDSSDGDQNLFINGRFMGTDNAPHPVTPMDTSVHGFNTLFREFTGVNKLEDLVHSEIPSYISGHDIRKEDYDWAHRLKVALNKTSSATFAAVETPALLGIDDSFVTSLVQIDDTRFKVGVTPIGSLGVSEITEIRVRLHSNSSNTSSILSNSFVIESWDKDPNVDMFTNITGDGTGEFEIKNLLVTPKKDGWQHNACGYYFSGTTMVDLLQEHLDNGCEDDDIFLSVTVFANVTGQAQQDITIGIGAVSDYYAQAYGCTDLGADNYDPAANSDDGSCSYPDAVAGCSDPSAVGYIGDGTGPGAWTGSEYSESEFQDPCVYTSNADWGGIDRSLRLGLLETGAWGRDEDQDGIPDPWSVISASDLMGYEIELDNVANADGGEDAQFKITINDGSGMNFATTYSDQTIHSVSAGMTVVLFPVEVDADSGAGVASTFIEIDPLDSSKARLIWMDYFGVQLEFVPIAPSPDGSYVPLLIYKSVTFLDEYFSLQLAMIDESLMGPGGPGGPDEDDEA